MTRAISAHFFGKIVALDRVLDQFDKSLRRRFPRFSRYCLFENQPPVPCKMDFVESCSRKKETVSTDTDMGHYCRICARQRPNEKFTGRGHRKHICKDCQRLPREELGRIECLNELVRFLDQSNISANNISRLETLKQYPNEEVRELAGLILEVALVKPHKRRRSNFLAQHHPDIWQRLRLALGDDGVYELSDRSIVWTSSFCPNTLI
jgi:hypothetical protein